MRLERIQTPIPGGIYGSNGLVGTGLPTGHRVGAADDSTQRERRHPQRQNQERNDAGTDDAAPSDVTTQKIDKAETGAVTVDGHIDITA